ncbi:Neuroligin-1 [Nymphon striatum]|nr:Neuroligin-1 [Nymphon striatum]
MAQVRIPFELHHVFTLYVVYFRALLSDTGCRLVLERKYLVPRIRHPYVSTGRKHCPYTFRFKQRGDSENSNMQMRGVGKNLPALFINRINLIEWQSADVTVSLFHRVILMSGSALASWAYTKSGAQQTVKLAEIVGCPVYDSQYLVHCLRKRPLNQILEAEVQVPFHDVAFGPIVDGVIIPGDPEVYLEDKKVIRPSYDLLLGVSKVEEYFSFTNKQVSSGMSADEQDSILSSYINHVTKRRKKEMLAMIKNEYTDWTKTNQVCMLYSLAFIDPFIDFVVNSDLRLLHPMNILNTVVEVLGDAKVIAPVIKTANINYRNSKSKHRQYVYMFGYQTRFGDYPTRSGSIHGEDLSYVFGAPLLRNGLAHFVANYSEAEAGLSESVIACEQCYNKFLYGYPF